MPRLGIKMRHLARKATFGKKRKLNRLAGELAQRDIGTFVKRLAITINPASPAEIRKNKRYLKRFHRRDLKERATALRKNMSLKPPKK